MSKIIFALLFSISFVYGLDFHSYRDALELQKKNRKIIMIDIVRTNCHYCTDMQKKVFDNPKMSKWLEKRFIAVKINLDTDEIPLDIEPKFTPSFYFVNHHKEIVKTIAGAWNIEDFKDLTGSIK